MMVKVTERDKKILSGFGFFCVAVILVMMVIMPLHEANKSLKEQIDSNREQILEMENKEARIPMLRVRNEEAYEILNIVQRDMYPILKTQDIDRLLTEMVMSYGMTAKKFQIAMPKEAADVAGYRQVEEGSSNPEKEDAVWIAMVSLEVAGSMEAMDGLVDELSLETPGVRIVEIRWDRNGMEGHIQLAVTMSRKD